MTAKTVQFKRPLKSAAKELDAWVSNAGMEGHSRPEEINSKPIAKEAMKRFTIDVPKSLHARIKVKCAEDGRKMADVLREMLEEKYPKT